MNISQIVADLRDDTDLLLSHLNDALHYLSEAIDLLPSGEASDLFPALDTIDHLIADIEDEVDQVSEMPGENEDPSTAFSEGSIRSLIKEAFEGVA